MDRAGFDHDVAVIGGGPSGSTAAAMLARLGRSVVQVESEPFPRFHIGESLLPRNVDVFDRIGVREKIEQAGFVEKWGASFQTEDGSLEAYVDFASAAEITQPRAWQVRRSTFDSLLFEHAASCGAHQRRARVTAVDIDEQGATLTLTETGTDAGNGTSTLRVRCVIDGGGRQSILGRRAGKRHMEPRLDNIAVHAQYTGIPRRAGRRQGDIRMVTRRDGGWSWFIPLDDDVTSVGVVLPKAVHVRAATSSAEDDLARYLGEMPAAQPLLAGAKRVSEARHEADYSYLSETHVGDRWLLVGDAAAFLDPVFSTGVLLGMEGGVQAAELVHEGLSAGDLSRARFRPLESAQIRRYEHFKRFVIGFYTPSFRAVFFRPTSRFGTVEAVLSILAGNWKPSLATRLRVELFFLIISLQRRFGMLDESPVREIPSAHAPETT